MDAGHPQPGGALAAAAPLTLPAAQQQQQDAALRAYFASLPPQELRQLLHLKDDTGQAAIHRAAAAGDVVQLNSLLAADPSLAQQRDSMGRSPLAVAAAYLQAVPVMLLAGQLTFGKPAEPRREEAQEVLSKILSKLPADGNLDARCFELTLQALLTAGASLAAATCYVSGMGTYPLLYAALRNRQYAAADALLRCGAAAQQAGPGLQPLHALALGVGQPTYLAPPATPTAVLAVAQRLVWGGAQLDAVATTPDSIYNPSLGLSSTPVLGYLCGCVPLAEPSNQQVLLSLIHLLLDCGASTAAKDARGNTPLHRLVAGLHESMQDDAPFVMLLNRLLSSGADLEATNHVGLTPLGLLLRQGVHPHCVCASTLEAAQALLGVGASLPGAGGGAAWYSVLVAALLAAPHADDKRRLTRELVELLVWHEGGVHVNDTSFLGMPPLAHLLEAALTNLLEEACDTMEIHQGVQWQLRPLLRERLAELLDLLLGAGADPNTLVPARAADSAALLEYASVDDESDDDELMSDSDIEEEAEALGALPGPMAAAVVAAERQRRRQGWCQRRLANRLEVAGACQAPLRQAVKLHDVQLTRTLLAAGASPGGGPGRHLLWDAVNEFSMLSWMASFEQGERRNILCWLLDTAETLLAAGCTPSSTTIQVAAPWSFRWLSLLENAVAGRPWSQATHNAYPEPFAAAVRTMLLINHARGLGGGGSGGGTQRKAGGRQHHTRQRTGAGRGRGSSSSKGGKQPGSGGSPQGRTYLPAELLHHILSLAAAPRSTWLMMLPAAEF